MLPDYTSGCCYQLGLLSHRLVSPPRSGLYVPYGNSLCRKSHQQPEDLTNAPNARTSADGVVGVATGVESLESALLVGLAPSGEGFCFLVLVKDMRANFRLVVEASAWLHGSIPVDSSIVPARETQGLSTTGPPKTVSRSLIAAHSNAIRAVQDTLTLLDEILVARHTYL
ncbi:hypothetical protein C2E23DRAFT_808628 [Lenzites betulinus]|nr:hypothetical protein C2E23DRAFT_808628 [Lenzites betulinus]